MKLGACVEPHTIGIAAEAGYEFAEWTVAGMLMPGEPEQVFVAALERIEPAEIRFEVVRGLVPGDLKVTGPEADGDVLKAYIQTVCKRAAMAGIEVVVFGSGGARKIPDGFDRDAAWQQLVDFCSMTAKTAAKHDVTIVIEPLRKGETNVLNTVAESAKMVEQVNHPNMRLLVDAFHLLKDGDSLEDVVKYGHLFEHVHIATKENRLAPAAEDCDFKPFFEALKKGGYTGRVSIESGYKDVATDLPRALALMRELA